MTMSRVLDISSAQPAAITSRPEVRAPANEPERVFGFPVILTLTGLGVSLLVAAAILLTRSSGVVAGLWLAGGIGLASWIRNSKCVRHDLAFAGTLAVSGLVGEMIVGSPPGLALLFAACLVLEVGFAVFLVRRYVPNADIFNLAGIARFIVCGFVAPIPSALIFSSVIALLGYSEFLEGFQTAWFGHALGGVVIGTLCLSISRRSVTRLKNPKVLIEALLLLALMLCCYVIAFNGPLSLGFIMLPVILVAAVRLGVSGTAMGILVLSMLLVGGTAIGYAPYRSSEMSYGQQVLMAQLLVLFGYMPVLLVAALLEERNRLMGLARRDLERAERASEAKSRLLANVAHEIKSPVAGVIGIGELWRGGHLGDVSPKETEMAAMLVKTARDIETLAHDLLDVARAESGAVKVELRPTEIAGLLEDVRRSMLLLPEAEGISIELDITAVTATAMADSQRLMQVVSNLTSNALKYGKAGRRVILRSVADAETVRIEVADFGPGLSPEKQEQLFEPFNRLGLERSSIEGHGVGLALAKRLTELQGGKIGVVSEIGHGATFWVILPRV